MKHYMYNPEMGTIGEREDYEDTHGIQGFETWASEHLTKIDLSDGVEIRDVFTTVETDTLEVAVGLDRICSLCGKTIPTHETHCEDVLICDGFVLCVLDTYHIECESGAE